MTGIKWLSVAAAAEGAGIVSTLDIDIISKIGVVGLLILAVVALWKDAGKRQDKLEAIIR